MRFRKHSHLAEGSHAFLSPSQYHWINYDAEKLAYRWRMLQAAMRGTEDHRYAAICIEEREVQDNEKSTLGLYINQCIQYKMSPEVVLYYSPNAFGTTDAIAYRHRVLQISDLKTGVSRASVHQLEVYASLFCLEYGIDPEQMRRIELRIYQDGVCTLYYGDPLVIRGIMNKIIEFDKQINELRKEVSE